MLSLICIPDHWISSLSTALTVNKCSTCDHYCWSWLYFELMMFAREMDWFTLRTLQPLNWDWTWSFRQISLELGTPLEEGSKPAQKMTASHWSGPSCEGACLVDLIKPTVLMLYEVPMSLSLTKPLVFEMPCFFLLCAWFLWNQELESPRVFKLLVVLPLLVLFDQQMSKQVILLIFF